MELRHIGVGYDGSTASEEAVRWAVREAAGRDVMVLLVTACPPAVPEAGATGDERLAPMVRAFSAQQAALARAQAELPDGVRAPTLLPLAQRRTPAFRHRLAHPQRRPLWTPRGVRMVRADVLSAAYTRSPDRFVRKHSEPPQLPTASWINKPTEQDPQHPVDSTKP